MSMTHGDKAECKELAREIVKEVLEQYVDACPHGKSLAAMKWTITGACVGSSIGGGGLAVGIMQLLT